MVSSWRQKMLNWVLVQFGAVVFGGLPFLFDPNEKKRFKVKPKATFLCPPSTPVWTFVCYVKMNQVTKVRTGKTAELQLKKSVLFVCPKAFMFVRDPKEAVTRLQKKAKSPIKTFRVSHCMQLHVCVHRVSYCKRLQHCHMNTDCSTQTIPKWVLLGCCELYLLLYFNAFLRQYHHCLFLCVPLSWSILKF